MGSAGVVAYILLCGYPPFNGSNNEETHGSVLRGRYSFPSQEWKHTSREARDFVRRPLQTDPKKRMTVEQTLNDPWMARYAGTVDTVMVDEERQDISSSARSEEEVVDKGSRLPKRGSMLSSKIGRRKLRISMFGI